MMMKGLIIQQPQHSSALDQENMSNLTSASGEASVSDTNGGIYPQQQQFFADPNQSQPVKKKRNQPGNPGQLATCNFSKFQSFSKFFFF